MKYKDQVVQEKMIKFCRRGLYENALAEMSDFLIINDFARHNLQLNCGKS